jgi:hypothetical protein
VAPDQFNVLDRSLYVPKGSWALPTGVLAASMPRGSRFTNAAYLVSGQQSLAMLHLDAGTLVTNVAFYSGSTAAVTPTNQWFSLYDVSRNLLAVTADGTTGAWAANTRKSLALATPYQVTASGLYYVGIMVAAATVPNMLGIDQSNGIAATQVPKLYGRDTTNTGLTTPATAPNPAGDPNTGLAAIAYIEIT